MKLDKPDPYVRVSVGYAAVPAKGREGYETEFNLLVYDNENGMLLETIVNRSPARFSVGSISGRLLP